MSCKVVLSAWPMWREPVMFGGGMTIVNGAAPARSGRPARNAPASCHAEEIRPSTACGSKVFSIIGSFRCRARALGGPAGAGRVKWERWQTSGQKASTGRGQTRVAPDLLCEANATARRFLFAARDPLDFGSDKALHDARQIVVEPRLEQGTQHLAC